MVRLVRAQVVDEAVVAAATQALAGLLEQHLDLVAVPRNREKPDRRASFALEHEGDERLSDWVEQHLSMAVWVRPEGADLGAVESVVVRYLHPPLNLDKVGEPRVHLRAARKRPANASRAPASGSAQAPGFSVRKHSLPNGRLSLHSGATNPTARSGGGRHDRP